MGLLRSACLGSDRLARLREQTKKDGSGAVLFVVLVWVGLTPQWPQLLEVLEWTPLGVRRHRRSHLLD